MLEVSLAVQEVRAGKGKGSKARESREGDIGSTNSPSHDFTDGSMSITFSGLLALVAVYDDI